MAITRTPQSAFRRRSQRIPLAVPLFVSSLDPNFKFSERCETVSVSSHGCRLRAPCSLEKGLQVRLDILHTDRTTNAHVVGSEALGPDVKTWEVSLELDNPENFWGIQFPPEDWAAQSRARSRGQEEPKSTSAPPPAAAAPKASTAAKPAAPPAPSAPEKAAPAPPKAPVAQRPAAPAPPPAPSQTAAPAPPKAPAPPPAPAPVAALPDVGKVVKEFERTLQGKAKDISSEFENSYRESLGDLLVRLRADFEERASSDWERLQKQAQQGLQEIAQQVRQSVDQDLERRRQDSTDAESKLQTVRKLSEEAEALLFSVGKTFRKQVAQERELLLANSREQLQTVVEQTRTQVQQDLARREKSTTDLQAHLEEVRQARDYVESLVRLLPQTVDDRVKEGVSGTLERIRALIEEEFSAQREAQRGQLEQHLLGLTENVGQDLRQKLLEDFDRSEREFLDRINVRLKEARAIEGSLQQYAGQMNSQLTQQAEGLLARMQAQLNVLLQRRQDELTASLDQRSTQLQQQLHDWQQSVDKTRETHLDGLQTESDRLNALLGEAQAAEKSLHRYAQQVGSDLAQQTDQMLAAMRTQLENLIEKSQGEITAHLEQQNAQFSQRAEKALRSLGEQAWNSVQQRLQTDFGQRQQELKETLEKTQAEAARLGERAEALAAQLDEGLEARLEKAATDTVNHTREQLEQAAETVRQTHLPQLQEELDQTLAPLVSRSEATAVDLHALLESLKKEGGQLETQAEEFHQEAEQARTWLTDETKNFQKQVHETLVEASGQIKGRIHLAIEMAQEPMERRARELRAQLEELSTNTSQDLAQQLNEVHEHLRASQSKVEASADSMLDARLTETLDRFRQQAEEMAQDSAAQVQATLNDTLESVSRLLREKLGPKR